MYEPEDVITAVFLAGGLTAVLTAFAFYVRVIQSKEFELLPFFGVMMVSIVVLMIFDLFFGYGNNKLWIAFGLCIYGVYLIIDLQRLLSESRLGMSLDDYIIGAMLIYLDIIMIFIKILQLIGKKKD